MEMTDTIRYTVDVDGDSYDHQVFLEEMADFNGATVVAQEEPED